jgi:recombinational DNA repair ATPase RecF
MINSVLIKNFRTHKETFIEFHPGVNVIIGDNEAGKTNILRAIHWAVNNRPTGDDYRSWWGGDTSVVLDVENKLVGRYKSNTTNLYTLTHADKTRDEFKAFGQSVPEIITQHLNMTSVNIHFQLEGPFLLNLSPADVARYFNSAVNLENIDSTISNIARTLREEKTLFETKEKDIEINETKLIEYNWLSEAEGSLLKLEETQQRVFKLRISINELETLMFDIEAKTKILSEFEEITKHEKTVKNLLLLNTDIEKAKIDIADLSHMQSTLIDLKETKNQTEEILKFEKEINRLIEFDKQIRLATEDCDLLQEWINELNELNEKHEELTDTLLDFKHEWQELMPEECPLCGRSCNCDKS